MIYKCPNCENEIVLEIESTNDSKNKWIDREFTDGG